jgi:hypothetical protein
MEGFHLRVLIGKTMKIIVKMLVLLMMTTGCVERDKNTLKSNWAQLSRTAHLKCFDWPQSEEELDASSIFYLTDRQQEFYVSQHRRRSGSNNFYRAKISGDEVIEYDRLERLSLSPGKLALRSLGSKGATVVNVMKNTENNIQEFEVFDVAHNRLIARSKKLNLKQEVETAVIGQQGFWILAHQFDEEGVKSKQLLYGQVNASKKMIVMKELGKLEGEDDIQIVKSPAQEAVFIFRYHRSRGFSSWFADSAKLVSTATDIKFKPASPVENWTAHTEAQKIYLSVLEGDSLEGRLELKVLELNAGTTASSLKIMQTLSLKLPDKHFGRPFSAQFGGKVHVLIPSWVDAESALAVIRADAGSLKFLGYRGVFKEGTVMVDLFARQQTHGLWGLFQTPKGYLKKFELCRIL